MDLISESPEAQDFLQTVVSEIDRYKRFPDEKFAQIVTGVLASSGVDLQREELALEALTQIAADINERSIWMRVEHNPLNPPVGRVLAARVFYAPASDLYFVAGVIGQYDGGRLPTFRDVGVDASALPEEHECDLPKESIGARIVFNPHELSSTVIEAMLEGAPDIVTSEAGQVRRKAAEPPPILTLVVSAWLLTRNPFSKKFLEKLGEQSAQSVIDYFSWLKNKLARQIAKLNRKTLIVWDMPYNGCRVEFVIASSELAVLLDAIDSLPSAGNSAVAVVKQMEALGIEKLVYEYDVSVKKWLPLHAATRLAGVVSDRPYLIALDQFRGFSIGVTLPEQ